MTAPTAYSGASGIYVIAVGAVIFERMRAVGASPRMALAVTAMSGSLGVVLRPCLVVVLIAVLNNNSGVTSDPLFYWGFRVFLLTTTLTLVVYSLWYREIPRLPNLAGTGEAVRRLGPLVPYAVVAIVVLLLYRGVAGTTVNENNAMYVLPVVFLAMVAWDRLGAGRADLPEQARGLWAGLTSGTSDSSHHIGALLVVMMGSVASGGFVERSDLMDLVPHELGSRWVAMTVLVFAMIAVGMFLDALGAVILVTVTIAPLAAVNGIDPVHFWIVVLVAFELGYLHPPVGLNILLARQVSGPDAEVERFPVATFAERYEHIIVPCTVMAVALVIVAYIPLFFY
jgi:TRAP-type C4-dicarboxylate transport system permease large subunit